VGWKICNSYSQGDDYLMIFTETKLSGSFLINVEKLEDERGFFTRSWDKKKFQDIGLNSDLVQCNISFNKKIGTLRGMHYQISPYQETKLVRCTRGKIFDVIIDLRNDSNTYKQWLGLTLDANNHDLLYIPEGFAHGFQTLEDNSEIFYQMSKEYYPKASRGIRWNDPTFGIIWPLENKIISEKDLKYLDYIDDE